jgi:hypothetical protein
MPKLTRTELAVIIGTFMVAITLNAVWRVRVMGAMERQRVEAELEAGADEAGSTEADPADASASPQGDAPAPDPDR